MRLWLFKALSLFHSSFTLTFSLFSSSTMTGFLVDRAAAPLFGTILGVCEREISRAYDTMYLDTP